MILTACRRECLRRLGFLFVLREAATNYHEFLLLLPCLSMLLSFACVSSTLTSRTLNWTCLVRTPPALSARFRVASKVDGRRARPPCFIPFHPLHHNLITAQPRSTSAHRRIQLRLSKTFAARIVSGCFAFGHRRADRVGKVSFDAGGREDTMRASS